MRSTTARPAVRGQTMAFAVDPNQIPEVVISTHDIMTIQAEALDKPKTATSRRRSSAVQSCRQAGKRSVDIEPI